MEVNFTKPFVAQVLSRMKKPSGLMAEDHTVKTYTTRVMTLKNLGLCKEFERPDDLYAALCQKYDKAGVILNVFRPAGSFIGNLSEQEAAKLGITENLEDIRRRYSSILTAITARRKTENEDKKRANAAVS